MAHLAPSDGFQRLVAGFQGAEARTFLVPSKQRAPDMPGLLHIEVPLSHNTTPKVCKKIQVIRQDQVDLRVTINRDCLFASDTWAANSAPEAGMLIGSQHVEDPRKVCPCCGLTYEQFLQLPPR